MQAHGKNKFVVQFEVK